MRLSTLPLSKLGAAAPDPPRFGKDEVKEIMRDTYVMGDRIILYAILVHSALALCFAPVYQTWTVTFLVGGTAALLFFLSVWLMPGRFITRCIAGLSLQMFTALHIYQYHGLPEMHFFFFTAFTLMIFYQDWRSMWPGALALIGQHLLFAIWANAGRNLYFFPSQEVPIEALKLTYHFGIALSQVGIAGVCAKALQQKRLRHAWQERKLRESGRLLTEQLEHAHDSEARLQAQTCELLLTRQRLEEDIEKRQEIEVQRQKTEEALHKYTRELEAARSHAENQAQLLKSQAVELQEVRDAAVASTHAKSQFLANMSHEIRTPMNGVLGMMELLRGTPLQPDQQDYVDTARSSAENLLGVLNDILDFSKIEAGKLSLENIPFSLRDLTEEVVEMFAPRAHVQGLELLCLISPELPEYFTGDPGRLRQILVNLLGNAFKFTAQGEVVLQAEIVRSRDHYAAVRLSVRDTGIGISRERQQSIFDSFTQADGSTTRKYGGTGLGLSISRQLTHLMGGEIGLDSVQGVGSVFWVELPLFIAAIRQNAGFDASSVLRGTRVLVVDDNVTHGRLLSEQLLSWGCVPDTAETGDEALRKLRSAQNSDPYQLALLDMQMPGMNGEQLAQTIREDARLKTLPLVLLSSMGKHSTETEIREKGFDASLNKPVRQTRLYNTLVELIGASEGRMDVFARRRPSAPCETPLNLNILLAEDNPVNQKFASRLLEMWECSVTLVTNGKEALEAASNRRYDLVLMDLQMPELDGLEVISRLRAHERGRQAGSANEKTEPVPVIAMTAHAMEGDRQRCLAAGMDDYIAKPFNRLELYEALSRWGRRQTHAPRRAEEAPSAAVELNWERLHAKCGNDEAFVGELIQEFLRQIPGRVERIQSAMEREDLSGLFHEAHTLRGGCLTLEAAEMAALSHTLEKASKENCLAACHKQIPLVLFASEKLNITLEQYLNRAAVER